MRVARTPPFFYFLVLIAALSLGFARTACGSNPSRPTVAEQYLFSALNAERTERGLPALRWDDALYEAAKPHAAEMAARGSISHQYAGEPDLASRGRSAGARFSLIAENVAEAATALEIHTAWMNSPGHRANILDGKLNAVGIRVVRRDGQLYAVQDFAHTVDVLTLEEQERTVASLLQAQTEIPVRTATEDARRTCEMSTGYAGRQPGFVMRFTAAELTGLPQTLRARLASGRYREAAVGACPLNGEEKFTAFSIAVLLYP
jgi:hypothetical protein